jgi:hypothetical protein
MVLIFLSMFGVMFLVTQYFQLILGYSPLGAALRFLPMAPIMIVVSTITPSLSARFGANRVVSSGMCGVTLGLLMFRGLTPHTPYWYILISIVPLMGGMALSMSPMTASIMSTVSPRRAGAGSAMNDATRELGAALGIALMGSLAASRYTSSLARVTAQLPAGVRHQAVISLADALSAATRLGGPAGRALTVGAQHAFIDGIHLAVTGGAGLSAIAAVVVLRRLPRQAAHGSALAGPVEAMEATAELGLAVSSPRSRSVAPDSDIDSQTFPGGRGTSTTAGRGVRARQQSRWFVLLRANHHDERRDLVAGACLERCQHRFQRRSDGLGGVCE